MDMECCRCHEGHEFCKCGVPAHVCPSDRSRTVADVHGAATHDEAVKTTSWSRSRKSKSIHRSRGPNLDLAADLLLWLAMTVVWLSGGVNASPVGITARPSRLSSPSSPHSSLSSHPRISEVCSETFDGSEGTLIKGFGLEQAFVVVTPGFRTPPAHMTSVPYGEHTPTCDFSKYAMQHLSQKVRGYEETVATKQKVKLKKDKSKFKVFKVLSSAELCNENVLSPLGVSQLISFGEYLLMSYFGSLRSIDLLHPFTSLAQTNGDEVLFQSLSAVLHGLLTEKQFVHAEIVKTPIDFRTAEYCKGLSCTRQGHEDLHYFVEKSFRNEYELLKDLKSPGAESNFIASLRDPEVSSKDIISHMASTACNPPSKEVHTDLSDVVNLNYSTTLINRVFNVSDSHNKYMSKNLLFQSYSKSRTLPLLHMVVSWMKEFLSNVRHLKDDVKTRDDLRIVAVDELFMLSFLSALNIPIVRHLTPTSRLVMEMHVLESSKRSDILSWSERGWSENLNNREVSGGEGKQDYPKRWGNIKAKLKDNKGEDSSLDKDVDVEETRKSILDSQLNGMVTKPQNIPSTAGQEPLRFIRFIYNGAVVTSSVPGCSDDDMISLGLCSVSTFFMHVGRMRRESGDHRDEL